MIMLINIIHHMLILMVGITHIRIKFEKISIRSEGDHFERL